MTYTWTSELRRLLVLLLLFALFGALFDAVIPALLLGLVAYTCWTLAHMHRLLRWIGAGRVTEPPESIGIWGDLYDAIYHLQQSDLIEKGRLRADIEYLRGSFSALSDGVVMVDSEGNIDWSNQSARRLLGVKYPQDRGQPLLNLLRDPGFRLYFAGEDYNQPLDFRSPSSPRTHLECQITFFGKRDRILFVRDVTRIKRLEQMRKDFVANVSHELRTPLTVISGYLQSMADSGRYDERTADIFARMIEQSTRMETLVEDLMLLSRLESVPPEEGNGKVEINPLLGALANDTLAMFGDEKRVVVDCPDNLVLYGSRKELQSAFGNLVNNAAKYSDGKCQIDIQAWVDEDGAHVSVTDDGMGIDPSHLPRLTERFYRVEKSRSVATGGTGLGLAIVKHVLIRHDGWLDIRSKLGKGSTFTCHFPPERLSGS